mgnify:FL=1
MVRRVIEIDEEACIGCGLCANACHEGAIGMVNGKAKLMRDDYCDGFGDCLPACPVDAIKFIEREAAAYDEAAVLAAKKAKETANKLSSAMSSIKNNNVKSKNEMKDNFTDANGNYSKNRDADMIEPCGCPGTRAQTIIHDNSDDNSCNVNNNVSEKIQSELTQWPVQIQLLPVTAPFYNNANLLIAADCTAYAYGDFHRKFVKNRVVLVGCPKLDDADYQSKLTAIISQNDIKSVTIVRMEVPCCGGLENAAKEALKASGKFIPWQVVTISTDGRILD